jgi:hypothetical protein
MVEITYKIVDREIFCFVDCQHKDERANHSSALDMRTEVGPRPKLVLQETKIYCSSFNNNLLLAQFGAVTITQLK